MKYQYAVKPSAPFGVTQMVTVCVQTAEVVLVIRPCRLCYSRPPYLPPRKTKPLSVKRNSKDRTYICSIYFGSLLFKTHNM
jgi:hypothetical protein